MTGKGDRWGRDRLGRSAPAFLSANISALPPPTCTARREAGRHRLWLLLFAARPANCGPFVVLRPVPGGESAGCVCLQCLIQQAVCLFIFACHAHCPHQRSCPRSFCFAPSSSFCFAPVHFTLLCLPLFHSMCARITVCLNSLQAARLSCWQLQHGPAVAARAPVPLLTFNIFFLQSP